MSKEFNKFWKRVKEENPDKVGKIGFMSFNELEEWSQRAFNAGAQIKKKKFVICDICKGYGYIGNTRTRDSITCDNCKGNGKVKC